MCVWSRISHRVYVGLQNDLHPLALFFIGKLSRIRHVHKACALRVLAHFYFFSFFFYAQMLVKPCVFGAAYLIEYMSVCKTTCTPLLCFYWEFFVYKHVRWEFRHTFIFYFYFLRTNASNAAVCLTSICA